MRWSRFCLIGGYCCHQLAKLVQQTSPKAGGELMTLKLNEVIFWNEPMITLISVCMVFFCGLGDQPTGPKYEVWQGFFLIMLLGLTPEGLPCFILFILFENMIRLITI